MGWLRSMGHGLEHSQACSVPQVEPKAKNDLVLERPKQGRALWALTNFCVRHSKIICDWLSARGFSIFLVDKQGCGPSTGQEADQAHRQQRQRSLGQVWGG